MVCNNCGGKNNKDAISCVNCNYPLIPEVGSGPAGVSKGIPPALIQAIIKPEEQKSSALKPPMVKKVCPECKYELIFDAGDCPMCSYKFSEPTAIVEKKIDQAREAVISPVPPKAVVEDSKTVPSSSFVIEPEIPHLAPVTPDTKPNSAEINTELSGVDSNINAHNIDIKKSIRGSHKQTTSPFVAKKEKRASVEGTIDPFRGDQVTVALAYLRPLGKDGVQELESISLAATDNPLPVNRATIDPENNTITSKTQAIFEFKNGEWYITDQSEQQTTFVRPKNAVKIEKGDLILMGNRKFIFDY